MSKDSALGIGTPPRGGACSTSAVTDAVGCKPCGPTADALSKDSALGIGTPPWGGACSSSAVTGAVGCKPCGPTADALSKDSALGIGTPPWGGACSSSAVTDAVGCKPCGPTADALSKDSALGIGTPPWGGACSSSGFTDAVGCKPCSGPKVHVPDTDSETGQTLKPLKPPKQKGSQPGDGGEPTCTTELCTSSDWSHLVDSPHTCFTLETLIRQWSAMFISSRRLKIFAPQGDRSCRQACVLNKARITWGMEMELPAAVQAASISLGKWSEHGHPSAAIHSNGLTYLTPSWSRIKVVRSPLFNSKSSADKCWRPHIVIKSDKISWGPSARHSKAVLPSSNNQRGKYLALDNFNIAAWSGTSSCLSSSFMSRKIQSRFPMLESFGCTFGKFTLEIHSSRYMGIWISAVRKVASHLSLRTGITGKQSSMEVNRIGIPHLLAECTMAL